MKARFFGLIASVAAGLFGAAACNADIVGYGTDTNSNLYSVNLTTAATSLIGNSGVFAEALALSGSGQLFAADAGGGLFTLDTTTGAATFIGSTGIGDIEGLHFNGSTLIGTNLNGSTSFYTIDTTTGAATLLTTTTPSQGAARAMTLSDSTHALIASDSPSFQSLVSTDLTTGATTVLGTMSSPSGIYGIDFGSDGNLYGLGGNGDVYMINSSTGATTVTGNTGGNFWLDLAVSGGTTAVPEPGAYAMLTGLVVPGAAFVIRRRRKA